MVLKNVCGGRALRIAVGITMLVLLLANGAGALKLINETGRDCISFGTWDSGTMTCTMTKDLSDSIQIESNGVILDGNGRTITITNYIGAGVELSGRRGVTIKNLNIENGVWGYGIFLSNSSNNYLMGNHASKVWYGIYLAQNSNNNTLSGNNVSNNNGYGIDLYGSDNTLIGNNANSNNIHGIYLSGSNNMLIQNNANSNKNNGFYLSGSDNTLISNNATNNTYYGISAGISNNNTFRGNNASNNQYGISLSGSNSILIENNANSNNNGGGITLFGSNNTLIGNIANSNTNGNGIYLSGSYNTLIGNNANSNNSAGISMIGSNSRLSGSHAAENGIGIYLDGSNNMLDSNDASNNNVGISISPFSYNNIIYNNYFKNKNNLLFGYSYYYFNTWNITKTSGMNIIGGPYLGGNFWAYPNGTGFSQTCTDSDRDGICDSQYNLASDNIDYLPLSMNFALDTTPPASVTNLTNITYAPSYINWTWTDPADADFEHVEIYFNGISRGNVAKGVQFFNATSLKRDTQYTIATRTVDVKGNVNLTWVNNSARTSPETIPVLLVHGWDGSSTETWNASMFTERGFDVETFDYNSWQDIRTSAGELSVIIKALVNRCKSRGYTCSKIDIVAHSEGGLVAREYINSDLYRNDVRKLIMIGTPNHGLDIKRYGDIFGDLAEKLFGKYLDIIIPMLTDIIVGTAGFQMEPHSPYLESLNGNDNCVESQTGIDRLNPSVQYYTLTAHPSFPTISHKHYKVLGIDYTDLSFTPDGDAVVADNSLKLTGVPFERKDNAGWHGGEGKNQVIIDQAISYLREDTQSMNQGQFAASNIEESTPYLSAHWSEPIIGKIYSGDIITHTVFIDNTTKKVNFNLFWENGDIDLVLYSPGGMEINSSSALIYPGINYTKESIFENYEIQNPQSGNWTMEITPVNVSSMGENYSVITFMDTDLFVGVGTNKDLYNPDEPITIFAYLQDSGLALPGVNVTTKMSKPDGTNSTLQLYDDGLHDDNQTDDGIYANVYTDTNVSGVYDITVLANGMKENNTFERIAFKTVWVEQYPDLTIFSSDINFSDEMPLIGKNITINAKIHNIGDANAINASILFYDGDPANDKLIGEDIINIDAGQIAQASVSWKTNIGKHEIYVLINPFNIFFEKNYTNNKAYRTINVTIDNTPKIITITSPGGGEGWIRGTTKNINWTSIESSGSYVRIELIKPGVPNRVVIASTLNDGSYSWLIPATLAPGNDYKVKITSTINASKNGTSDNFTIQTPSIDVVSPNGGETWRRGTTQTIKWNSSGSPGTYVKIELLKGGVLNRVIIASTPNDGSHPWLIPATQAPGTDYKVRITSTTNAAYNDTSDANFTIHVPSITVATPNGAENWTRGTTKIITWNSTESPGTYVKIELLKAGVLNRVIVASTLNDGSHPWFIPATLVPGNDYKVKITSIINISNNDTSDDNFTIPTPSITIATPNGGENWTRGTTKIITWNSTESPGTYVKIELQRPGKPNQLIISATLNDGLHSWLIPAAQAPGSDYKVKITSTINASNNDTSDDNFTIPAPSFRVVSPNGGENWIRGSTQIIKWNSTESPRTYVKIELLKAGVLNRVVVASTINDGSHPWLIPVTQATGSDYRVKITSTNNISNYDVGNSDFTIGS